MTKETTKRCPKCKEEIAGDATKCKHCGADLRNWFAKHKVLTGILGLLIFVVFVSSFASTDTANTVDESSNESKVENKTGETKEKKKGYVKVLSFKGSGQKKSESFKITGDRFKIAYDCRGDLCQAWASKPGSDFAHESIMNTTEPIKDETIIYESGEWYIEVNSIGTWSMTVYDYR